MRVRLSIVLVFVLVLILALPGRALPANQPPAAPVINHPTYSSWFALENLTLTATTSDYEVTDRLNWTWSWDDGTITKTTGSASTPTSTATHMWTASGNYSVSVNVSDGYSGPLPSLPIYVNVSVDSIPPVTAISASGLRGNGVWYIGPVTVTLSATDAGSSVASTAYRIDGDGWQTYLASFILETQGNHTVSYRSVDKVGNVETTQAATFPVDSLAPVILIRTPANGSVVSAGPVTVTWNATDSGSGVASVQYSIDGGVFTSAQGSSLTLQGLADGAHTVVIRATDVAGNTATTSVSFSAQAGVFGSGAVVVGGIVALTILAVAATAVLRGMQRRKGMPPIPPPPNPPPG